MANNILYYLYTSTRECFAEAIDDLLEEASNSDLVPIRMVFYGRPDSNEQYGEQLAVIREKVECRWPAREQSSSYPPLVSYVAQHPQELSVALETQMVGREFAQTLHYRQCRGVRYIVSDRSSAKLLYTEGILADFIRDSIRVQSEKVLAVLEEILATEQMPIDSIVRQWNYIEQITRITGSTQHYQDFNDARSHFYAKTSWPTGYPAATGIGTDFGGVMVEVDAELLRQTTARIVAIDNPLQVAAHHYSQGVLIGEADRVFKVRTTPKFERAKAIAQYDCAKVYISGTAAIRGEESLAGVGIEQQTIITLENIEYLVSKKNLADHGVTVRNEPELQIFRVYLKYEADMAAAREIIRARYPYLPTLYVLTDVCRDELLIEIEGVAQC